MIGYFGTIIFINLLLLLKIMAQDKNCPFNLEGMCFEMIAHGFHEKQLREEGRMKPCDMLKDNNGFPVTSYRYCSGYQSFQTACQTPGIISPRCYEAIRDAKYYDKVDGRIVDLKSRELSSK